MNLIKNMIIIPINDEKYLIVNTLNGLIDEIDQATHNTIQQWRQLSDSISPQCEQSNVIRDIFKTTSRPA